MFLLHNPFDIGPQLLQVVLHHGILTRRLSKLPRIGSSLMILICPVTGGINPSFVWINSSTEYVTPLTVIISCNAPHFAAYLNTPRTFHHTLSPQTTSPVGVFSYTGRFFAQVGADQFAIAPSFDFYSCLVSGSTRILKGQMPNLSPKWQHLKICRNRRKNTLLLTTETRNRTSASPIYPQFIFLDFGNGNKHFASGKMHLRLQIRALGQHFPNFSNAK